MIDPTRAAIPTHPLCAASDQIGRRHRVGPQPYVVHGDAGHREFCTTVCLFAWRARNPNLWAGSRLEVAS